MQPNWIYEINAFYNWAETTEIKPDAISLWHALMFTANKAHWKSRFNASASLLCARSGLSKSSFQRARNALSQMGRIKFYSRKGNQSAVYEIIFFSDSSVVQYEPQSEPQLDHKAFVTQYEPQSEPQPEPQSEPQPGHILKHKQEINKTTTTVVACPAADGVKETCELFEKNVHPFSGLVEREMLCDLVESYGSAWVQGAIREAIRQGILRLSYITGILKSWKIRGGPNIQRTPAGGKSLTAAEREDLIREGFEL